MDAMTKARHVVIRRWSDTVYAGYVDDGGWFGRFVGCGSLAEAVSYVEAATGRQARVGNARTTAESETIGGIARRERVNAQPPDLTRILSDQEGTRT